jgi:hypothetical protein
MVVLSVFVGCADERRSPTTHTLYEAKQIAVLFAQKSGRDLGGYKLSQAYYESRFRDWWIIFQEKPPQHPGGDIIISVDDASGEATLVPSR